MVLTVYLDLASQPCRALYIFLKIAEIPHKVQDVALRKGEHLTEDYKENINPFALVPAINDDGFRLTESVAILQYLCNKYRNSRTEGLYPSNQQQRARIDAFNNWQHLNIRMGGAYMFQALVLAPMLGKNSDERLKVGRANLKKSLNNIEDIFLKDTSFIYSPQLSIADLLGVCELMQPYLGAGVDVFTGYPTIKSWVENVRRAVGEELFDETHKWVKAIGDRAQAGGLAASKL